jgi:hypothetical protein
MIKRVAHGPCLGVRVSALADGSMAPDAATRALAHVACCRVCADALEVERLTLQRLRSLPSPMPSGDLMVALLQLGEPGGPVPLRRRPVPGTARPATAAVAPPAGRAAAAWPGTSRPQGSRRPGGRALRSAGTGARMQRRAMLAAAGALGVGVLAMGSVGLRGTTVPGGPAAHPPLSQISVQQARVHEAVLQQIRSRSAGTAGSGASAALTPWGSGATVGPVVLQP